MFCAGSRFPARCSPYPRIEPALVDGECTVSATVRDGAYYADGQVEEQKSLTPEVLSYSEITNAASIIGRSSNVLVQRCRGLNEPVL